MRGVKKKMAYAGFILALFFCGIVLTAIFCSWPVLLGVICGSIGGALAIEIVVYIQENN